MEPGLKGGECGGHRKKFEAHKRNVFPESKVHCLCAVEICEDRISPHGNMKRG